MNALDDLAIREIEHITRVEVSYIHPAEQLPGFGIVEQFIADELGRRKQGKVQIGGTLLDEDRRKAGVGIEGIDSQGIGILHALHHHALYLRPQDFQLLLVVKAGVAERMAGGAVGLAEERDIPVGIFRAVSRDAGQRLGRELEPVVVAVNDEAAAGVDRIGGVI